MATVIRTLLVRALTWGVTIGVGAVLFAALTPRPHPKTAHRHDDGLIYFDCTKPLMSPDEAARPWKPDGRQKPSERRSQSVKLDD